MARRKCQPGVFCIENTTIIFLIIVILLFLYIIYYLKGDSKQQEQVYLMNNQPPSNIFNNPFKPPLKDNHYFPSDSSDIRGVPRIPINIQTQALDTHYKQVGILTRITGPETILALMGRPTHASRNKWQYYTMSDKQQSVKLPVTHSGRSCTNELGCDEIFNGDSVYVEGYNDAFKATVYESNLFQYIPY
jgi:hypothetical protein